MALSDHPHAYSTAAIALAFISGVLITLGLKDLYPDLEQRYKQRRRGTAKPVRRASDARRRSSFFWGPVALEDHEDTNGVAVPGAFTVRPSAAFPPSPPPPRV